MRIKVEPKDFFMHAVFLAFSPEHPDPEDDVVRAHLTKYKLEPKWQRTEDWEGQKFRVMYFGGCYLGRHLQAIGGIQREFVERELLAAEIEALLEDSADVAVRNAARCMQAPALKETIARIVPDLHQQSSFVTDEEGVMRVSLDPWAVQKRFLETARDGG